MKKINIEYFSMADLISSIIGECCFANQMGVFNDLDFSLDRMERSLVSFFATVSRGGSVISADDLSIIDVEASSSLELYIYYALEEQFGNENKELLNSMCDRIIDRINMIEI